MPSGKQEIWLTDPKAYQQKLGDLLGDQDPLDVLARTPGVLSDITKALAAEVMRTRPFEGKWTPNEIVGHLSDVEWTFGNRTRAVLCDQNPSLIGIDQERWVSTLGHNEREPSELLEMFARLRGYNLAMFRRLTPSELARTGEHNERGTESLGLMIRMEAGHDLSHIDQIKRYLAAIDGR